MKVAVSILKSKLDIKDCIKKVSDTDCDLIHVDVMDGVFVENHVMSCDEINELFKDSNKKLDIHLMVSHPMDYIKYIKLNNINDYVIHIEINDDINYLIDYIHSLNIKVSIAINPNTSIDKLYPYLDKIDYILIMGVMPGAGGQTTINSTIKRINLLLSLKKCYNYSYLLSFDGGVNNENIKSLEGLDMVVSGSYICMSDNFQEKINSLR